MKVLGIDTGIAIVGWSIVEKNGNKLNVLGYGTITTLPTMYNSLRLKVVYEDLVELIKEYEPDHVAIESLFYFKNKKTIITVGQARGVILLAAEMCGKNIYEYTPLQVKTSVTGYGRADKQQMQKMVQNIYKLDEIPKPDDAADALAIAYCHSNTYHI